MITTFTDQESPRTTVRLTWQDEPRGFWVTTKHDRVFVPTTHWVLFRPGQDACLIDPISGKTWEPKK